MNNKGQALVEFILILPIFIIILFIIVDFGMIFNKKSGLENNSSDIVEMISNNEDLNYIKTTYPDLEIKLTNTGKYIEIEITSKVDLITPGLNRVLGDPYSITVKRVVPNV